MSLAVGAIQMGRKQAEALIAAGGMTGVVKRKIGVEEDPDPVTLEEIPIWSTIYTGPGKLRMPGATVPGTAPIPGAIVTDDESILSLPVLTSGDVRVDDVWEVTANPLDTSLVGVKFRIAGAHHQTFATARRFPVVETN